MKTVAKIKKFLKSDNFRSFWHTLVTNLIWDASIGLAGAHIINGGDWSQQSILAFGYAIFRTIFRVLFEALKKQFPKDS